jgi:hypothetical protein
MDRYVLEEIVGTSSHGVVWKSMDLEVNAPRAIKFYADVEVFKHEITMLRMINDPVHLFMG